MGFWDLTRIQVSDKRKSSNAVDILRLETLRVTEAAIVKLRVQDLLYLRPIGNNFECWNVGPTLKLLFIPNAGYGDGVLINFVPPVVIIFPRI